MAYHAKDLQISSKKGWAMILFNLELSDLCFCKTLCTPNFPKRSWGTVVLSNIAEILPLCCLVAQVKGNFWVHPHHETRVYLWPRGFSCVEATRSDECAWAEYHWSCYDGLGPWILFVENCNWIERLDLNWKLQVCWQRDSQLLVTQATRASIMALQAQLGACAGVDPGSGEPQGLSKCGWIRYSWGIYIYKWYAVKNINIWYM